MNLSKEDLYKLTDFYDTFGEHFEKLSRSRVTFNEIKKVFSKCLDKNSSVLQTNLIGRQLLVNRETERQVYDALDISEREVRSVFESSEYFGSFGKLALEDQIIFGIPLIMMAGAYLKVHKDEEARLCYLFAFMKPYASIISKYFPYGINDDRMRYTIEMGDLTNKSDIRKLETVLNMLVKKAEISLENYKNDLLEKTTDRQLHVIFTSGIQSRINNTVNNIKAAYENNKGKYLPFEDSSFSSTDKDGATDTVERDIESDTAIKAAIVNKAVDRLSTSQIDSKMLVIAAQIGLGVNNIGQRTLENYRSAVHDVIEKEQPKFREFYECLIGSILFHTNPQTGLKYSGKDLLSPVYLKAALSIFKKKNVKDKNTIRTKEIVKEMLENSSEEYNSKAKGGTIQDNFKMVLFTYLVLVSRGIN